ncbi:hypothetical protein [Roseateles paludis]|uniref:Chromosome partition protein MukF middle domain-containing protein n=1 Tax=Roseateles paludis TaxID=3145238 RepID=A0ABV0FVV0_9BURK
MQIAHELLVQQRSLQLEARDLALLLMVHDALERRAGAFCLTVRDLLTLSTRLDRLEALDTAKARMRLTGSLSRLVDGDCLMRVDLHQVGHPDEAQYQLTTVGLAWVAWELDRARFTGAPLVALLRAFNTQIEAMVEKLPGVIELVAWQAQVELPLRSVVGELLHGIHRHQVSLDRQHAKLRDEIPGLLSDGSDDALVRCEAQLREVQTTIRDLHDASTAYGTTGLSLLGELRRHETSLAGELYACAEVERRLLSVLEWAAQRSRDWTLHYQSVHQLIRTVIRVDRERRVTAHLKRAITVAPTWTLAVPDAPKCYRLRNEADDVGRRTKQLRRERTDYSPLEYVRQVDEFPRILLELANEHLARGQVRWSEVLREAMQRAGRESIDVLRYLPRLMAFLVSHGALDPTQRAPVSFDHFVLEELRVIQR